MNSSSSHPDLTRNVSILGVPSCQWSSVSTPFQKCTYVVRMCVCIVYRYVGSPWPQDGRIEFCPVLLKSVKKKKKGQQWITCKIVRTSPHMTSNEKEGKKDLTSKKSWRKIFERGSRNIAVQRKWRGPKSLILKNEDVPEVAEGGGEEEEGKRY